MLEAGRSSTLFPCENWVCFWKEYCFPVRISKSSNINFVPNSSFQVNGRSPFSLVRKQSMLEAEGSGTLFSYENWVSLLKEYWWHESILKWANHLLYEKYLLWDEMEKHMYIMEQHSVLEAGVSCTLFPYELLKGILPTTKCFHVWGTSPLCQKFLSSEWNKHRVSCKKSIIVTRRRIQHYYPWKYS
jgi:hypothetical protein